MRHDGSFRRRDRLAACVERATISERPFIGSWPRHLVHPNVAAICTPSLRTIATALRDDTRPVDEASLEAVHRFVSDMDLAVLRLQRDDRAPGEHSPRARHRWS